jgi:hypothetical protein
MSEVATALPTDSPIMLAWERYKSSQEYANSFKWAAHEEHRNGSMWAAFFEGWNYALEQKALANDKST